MATPNKWTHHDGFMRSFETAFPNRGVGPRRPLPGAGSRPLPRAVADRYPRIPEAAVSGFCQLAVFAVLGDELVCLLNLAEFFGGDFEDFLVNILSGEGVRVERLCLFFIPLFNEFVGIGMFTV